MKKRLISTIGMLLVALFTLSGCDKVGDKTASLVVVYIVTSVLALLLLIGYCVLLKKKDPWFLLLFSSVSVVNIGYLTLSISSTVEEALLANRISYLGSVFLPLAMYMIILNTCKINYKKWVPSILLTVCVFVFLIAASPGYLDIYYKSVTIEQINGVTVLNKVYGPWHSLYLYYLLTYFTSVIVTITYAIVKKKLDSSIHAIILAMAVFVNMGVWLLEQLVKFDFELLSISYIVSELFLLSLYLLLQEKITLSTSTQTLALETSDSTENSSKNQSDLNEEEFLAKRDYLVSRLCTLTPTEREIYSLYLKGKTTKEIMTELNIKENTLKYHNKNIYSKLGVSSRKELLLIATAIKNPSTV